MTTTNIYNKKGELVRSEGLVTLRKWVMMGRLKSGQKLLIGNIEEHGGRDEGELHTHTLSFWVGDCTPHIQRTTNDGGIGWDYNDPQMKKFVLEVYDYTN